MHPSFKHHMDKRKVGETLRLNVSTQEKTKLEDVLAVEGGSMSELLIEGIWRVIASRKAPPDLAVAPITRPKQSKNEKTLNFRMSNEETAALASIASKEQCTPTRLIGEGIWHVITDRQQDPQYQAGAARILELLGEVEAVRAELHQQPQIPQENQI
jgi:hypothetical protein